jgi:flagellar motor switch protein FliM
LRNFTSDNVEVSLDRITSVRFGDYMNSIPLPAVLSVFKAEEWENFGLATVDSSLIYSMIDVLLGGRRGQTSLRIEGRPYTTIETNLVKRLVEVVLADAEQAFRPLSPVTFTIDRLETNPRFAAISRPANAAILVRLHIDMEDRGGNIELLLPYATIEPIRPVLLQMFMGEKFGRDPIWEGHFATEVAQAEISVDAVLYEADIPLKQLMKLKVGDTLPLEMWATASRSASPSSCVSRIPPSRCSRRPMSKTRRWRPNESYTWNCNRKPGRNIAHVDNRVLHALEHAPEAAEGG